jgi:hypothetical protein
MLQSTLTQHNNKILKKNWQYVDEKIKETVFDC